jgi:serine/threonine protein kinase
MLGTPLTLFDHVAAEHSDDDDEGEDFSNSREDQLFRALAAAPSPDAKTLLARALPAFADTLESSPHAEHGAPAVGTLIEGRYRIDETLGSGGMGIVFGATHVSTGRRVALKWMLSHGLHRTPTERTAASQRFVREAQATGRIKHPNVVDVYDAGVDPQQPYLVMERLEGETLRARMERGPLDWDAALAIILPVMEGVAAAHREGVVHRDLKPDNVFLARAEDGSECPKVLDFGISRLRVAEAGEPSLTRTGTMIGTPAYMPLEQLRGLSDVDERIDIYALGVVLYEMLAGTRPYVARNAADFAALLTSEAPTPVSRHRPELAGQREAAVMKALARDPGARHENVTAFVKALTAPPEVVVARAPRRGWLWMLLTLLALVALAWSLRRAALSATPERTASEHEPVGEPPPRVAPSPPAQVAPAEAENPAPTQPVAPPSPPATTRPQRATRPPSAPAERDGTRMQADDFVRSGSSAQPAQSRARPAEPPSLDLDRGQF